MTSKGISAPPDWTFHTTQQPRPRAGCFPLRYQVSQAQGVRQECFRILLRGCGDSVQGYPNWLATRRMFASVSRNRLCPKGFFTSLFAWPTLYEGIGRDGLGRADPVWPAPD